MTERQELFGGDPAIRGLSAGKQSDDARDRLRGENPADLTAGELQHVGQVEREQRQPRSPDDVLQEHHDGEPCRGRSGHGV
jgi:hypothetical protein